MDSKSPDAFRTISEVADDLDLPQHVLRFWETRFSQIKPMKRGGGRRYYRPDDVDLLRGIRHLLYGEGYTIKGVQRILREQGVRYVMDITREGVVVPADEAAAAAERPVPPERSVAPASKSSAAPAATSGKLSKAMHAVSDDEDYSDVIVTRAAPGAGQDGQARTGARAPAPRDFDENDRYEAFLPDKSAERPPLYTEAPAEPAETPAAKPETAAAPPSAEPEEPLPRDVRPDDEPIEGPHGRRGFRLMDRLRGDRGGDDSGQVALSRDEVRRLQSTLFELLECKRLLDQAR